MGPTLEPHIHQGLYVAVPCRLFRSVFCGSWCYRAWWVSHISPCKLVPRTHANLQRAHQNSLLTAMEKSCTSFPLVPAVLAVLAFQVFHAPLEHRCVVSTYCSLEKEQSLRKERPPPTFDPIPCIEWRFSWMSTHPGASFTWSLRTTASSAMFIWGKKLHAILQQRLLQGIFA